MILLALCCTYMLWIQNQLVQDMYLVDHLCFIIALIFILLHYSFVARGNIGTKYTSSSKLIWYCINVIWTIPYTNFQEHYNQWTWEWIHNLCKQQIELRMSGIILEVALFLYWYRYIILKSSCRQFKLF